MPAKDTERVKRRKPELFSGFYFFWKEPISHAICHSNLVLKSVYEIEIDAETSSARHCPFF